MLIEETVFTLLGFIIGAIATYLVLDARKNLQIPAMNIFALSVISIFLNMTLFFPMVILSNSNAIDSVGGQIAELNFSIGVFVIFLSLQLLFFLPSFKLNYTNIVVLMSLVASNTVFMVLSLLTSEFSVVGSTVKLSMIPATQLFFALNQVLVLLLVVRRIREIRRVLVDRDTLLFSRKIVAIFFIFIILVGPFLFFLSDEGTNVPFMSQTIIGSFIMLLIAYVVNAEVNTFFVLPIRFHGLIITHQKTGIVLYSGGTESDSDILLGGLFTALNISLQEAIQSESHMSELTFEDKVVHVAPGKYTTCLLFLSDKTLMTQYVAKYLTRVFEQEFDQTIVDQSYNGMLSDEFDRFKTYTSRVAKLFI